MSPLRPQGAEAFLADAELLLGRPDDDVKAVYERVADRYDHFRELWLRLAGAGAEAAMLADVGGQLRPGTKVLDAGVGTRKDRAHPRGCRTDPRLLRSGGAILL